MPNCMRLTPRTGADESCVAITFRIGGRAEIHRYCTCIYSVDPLPLRADAAITDVTAQSLGFYSSSLWSSAGALT